MTARATPAEEHRVSAVRPLLPSGLWIVDPERSLVAFAVRHLAVATVRGRFTDFEGWFEAAPDGTALTGGRVVVDSVDTDNPVRDDRLRSPDCFDVDRHPEMRFEGAVRGARSHLIVDGRLGICGTIRPLRLRGEVVTTSRLRAVLVLRGEVRRSDFGLRWSSALEAGGAIVSDRVAIRLKIALRRAP